MTPERLAALHAASFTVPRPWTAAEFAALLADPLCDLRATTDGFGLIRTVAGEAELLTLAVAPEARRRGVGRALLAELMQTAGARGAEAMLLEVAADNAAARALYARAGFAEIGRRRGYYRGAEGAVDALVMRAAVSAGGPSETPQAPANPY